MLGNPVKFTPDQNRIEIIQTLMRQMQMVMQWISMSGVPASQPQIVGLQNMSQHISEIIQSLDKSDQTRYEKELVGIIRAFAQSQRTASQQQQNGQGQIDPKDIAKIAAERMKTQGKLANMRESHATRTAQKEIQWEREQQREEARHQLELRRELERENVEDIARGLEAGSVVRRNLKEAQEQPI
jgi:hypothetical protein